MNLVVTFMIRFRLKRVLDRGNMLYPREANHSPSQPSQTINSHPNVNKYRGKFQRLQSVTKSAKNISPVLLLAPKSPFPGVKFQYNNGRPGL